MPCAVVTHEIDPAAFADAHIRVARGQLGARLAALHGCAFAAEHDPSAAAGALYFVPSDTLTTDQALALGIAGEDDLFGGVVPFAFVATKAITHPLVGSDAAAPPGWSVALGERMRGAVLAGFSTFSVDDARRAGARLLEHGPVRTKPARASAGRDQHVVASPAELDVVLDALGAAEIADHGLVIEENLTDVATYSVGQVRVAGSTATYHGEQRLTADNRGEAVYGGSDLVVANGGFDALLALDLTEAMRDAVAQARAYDAAAFNAYPGLFVSRRNYDIITGVDARGHRRSAVLEQSWRMGGASSAEIAAIEAFRADPALKAVRASSFESYGGVVPPDGATVYYHGVDPRIGAITRYATVEPA